MTTKELGFLAENIAARYLQSKGYEILERNYRKPWGEVDVIVKKEGVIIFVEVKANKRAAIGFEPEIRVDWKKANKIKKVAEYYLKSNGVFDVEYQVDVIAVTFYQDRQMAKLKHFKNV